MDMVFDDNPMEKHNNKNWVSRKHTVKNPFIGDDTHFYTSSLKAPHCLSA
jgi:hypothetical protein